MCMGVLASVFVWTIYSCIDQSQILEYMSSVGLNLMEAYGLSETTGPHTVSSLTNQGWKMGSIGRDVSSRLMA